MADMGFLPEVTELLERIPAGGQRLLFSATLDGDVDTLVERFLTDPVTHSTDAGHRVGHHDGRTTCCSSTPQRQDRRSPPRSPAAAGRTIMFVRTQLGVDRLAEQLAEPASRRRAARRQDPARAHPRPGRVPRRPDERAGRHRRRGPRHPRRRRRPGRPRRPADGPQGLPAPRRAHRAGRRVRHRRHPGPAATSSATSTGSRRRPASSRSASGSPPATTTCAASPAEPLPLGLASRRAA